jgi:hypothetical protein
MFLAKAVQSDADPRSASVRHVKPASSRQDSSEGHVLAIGFRGAQKPAVQPPSLRGAKATKQSTYPLCCAMDCFASLAMTRIVRARHRFARKKKSSRPGSETQV